MAISTDMLAAFVKVAELGSVSRAADQLDVGKGVVSKRVAQLESLLGATLFSRSTRRIALTAAGEAYADHARRALGELSAGHECIRALRSELTGSIRLTSTVSWGQRVLVKVLPEFARLHPGIELELHLDDRRVDLAYERFDCALRWSVRVSPHLVSTPVACVGWLLAAAPAYLAGEVSPAHPRDLVHCNGLGYWREADDDLWSLACADEVAEVTVRSRYRAANPEAVLEAAIAGLGVAMLPDYLCQEALSAGRLVRVLPAWTPQTKYGTAITAVATVESMRLPRIQALLAHLRQALAPR